VSNPAKEPLWTKDFVLITICNLLIFLGYQTMPSTLPIYLNSPVVGAPDAIIGWVLGIGSVSAVLSRPFTGLGVDLIGRRVFLVAGILGMTLTFVVIPNLPFIFIIRFLNGIFWAMACTAATTIMADVVKRSHFGKGVGFFSLSNSLGLAIAPAFALYLLTNRGYSFNLIIVLSICTMLVAFAVTFFLRYKKVPRQVERSAQKAVLKQARALRTTPRKLPREKRTLREFLKRIFERGALVPAIVIFCNNMVQGTVVTFLSIHALSRGIESVHLYFLLYACVLIIARPTVGILVDRYSYKAPTIIGLSFVVIALFLIASSTTIAALLVASVFHGIGHSGVHTSLLAMSVADAPFERRGAATSTYYVGFDGGYAAGAFVSGVIAGIVGYTKLFFITVYAPLSGLILFLILTRKPKNLKTTGQNISDTQS